MLDITTRTTSFYKMGRTDPYYFKDRSGPHSRSRTNNNEKPKVVAGTFLRKDACSEVIDVDRLAMRSLPVASQISIVEQGGRLCCSDGQTSSALWLKAISISQDCQSSNAMLSRTDGGVVLTILKSIEPNEPLLMWFAEDVRLLLNLPHLTPEHLSADNKYKCGKCYLHFDNPNPLKIHIALNCNAVDADHLWMDLARNFSRIPMKPYNPYPLVPKFEPFNFELSGSPPTSSTPNNTSTPIKIPSPPGKSSRVLIKNDSSFTSNLVSLSTTTNDSSFNGTISSLLNSSTASDSGLSSSAASNSSYSTISENSYTSLTNNSISPSSLKRKSPATITSSQIVPRVIIPSSVHPTKGFHPVPSAFKPYVITPECFSAPAIPPMSHHFNQPPVPMPPGFGQPMSISQMESFVSNLGKSNRGHLCLWCGKMYSRKYGLKIHIRTHTGYKPLKCKFCARPFGDPSNLNKHVRLHAEGETPYRCDLCGKVMVRRRDLERHMKSRHQENNDRNPDNMSSDEMDDV